MYKAAGRPWPILTDDDVLDYMVMEAVALKVADEDKKKEKEAKEKKVLDEWKKDTSELEEFR